MFKRNQVLIDELIVSTVTVVVVLSLGSGWRTYASDDFLLTQMSCFIEIQGNTRKVINFEMKIMKKWFKIEFEIWNKQIIAFTISLYSSVFLRNKQLFVSSDYCEKRERKGEKGREMVITLGFQWIFNKTNDVLFGNLWKPVKS